MNWPNHGGQPETMKQRLNINVETVLDFSANLNPLGPPLWLKQQLTEQFESITRYPEPSYLKSRCSIASSVGVHQDEVLVTNGGAEAIFLVAKYFENRKALIVQPTFSEYERACLHYHIDVEDVFLEKESQFQLPFTCIQEKLKYSDVVFLCRPNNPTGTVIEKNEIERLLKEAIKNDTYIVVDEAFVDFLFTSDCSLTSFISSYPNLILLRSLTKMYTIPGLRIGYLIANRKIIKALQTEQIPWSVNALVDAIVPHLLTDHQFVEKTKKWLSSETRSVTRELSSLNFYVSLTSVNFYLLHDNLNQSGTDDLFRYLFKNGILTRHTHNFKGLDGQFLRIAIRSKQENEQLLYWLKKWRQLQ
ncbi:threonine-phosphate decarboxylase [Anaerobacillus arseniciselenatis]|uniref:threonine-phosphate decarboxylase n=1 Tax=Anaerobacillus arseniciselenatis TaxID=85682 RepID=A0A1S2LKR9_9BACI|nr:threonine-phosphate decarboxylase CobD [Anaerobacillus arseniciselenatis]OIJ12800.1 threonine-phosphate decarboxylase [Anaerobacillus arseniciselenatis]